VLQILKRKTVYIPVIVAVLAGLYALAGFVIAPKLVRSALLEQIPKNLVGVTATVGEIHINPFLFQVSVGQFALNGPEGEKLVGFDRLFVDFELSSIWHRAYSFGNIDITAPYVNAKVAKDGSLNLLQLKPKPTQTTQPAPAEGPLPALRIGSFQVSQGSVSYEDHSRPDEFAARLQPINFELHDFSTGVEGGRFTFTGVSKQGERIEWHGHVSVQPIESDGEFQINGLQAHTLWEYLEDQLNFRVNSGTIDLAANYKFSADGGAAPASLQVDMSKVALTDLAIRPKDSDVDWIAVPALIVTGTRVDLNKREAHVDLVSLSGLKVVAWLESNREVNLMRLAAPVNAPHGTGPPALSSNAAAPAAAASAGTPSASGTAPEAPAWHFDLREFDLRDANISAEDRSVHPSAKLVLAPLSVQVNGVSEDLTKPLTVSIDTRINESGSLSVKGGVTPRPAAASLDLKLADLDLTLIQPYIAQYSSMTLVRGRLGADTKLKYAAGKTRPAVQVSGNLDLQKLHTVDDALHEDFINWDRLDIQGIDYRQSPDHLDVDQIVARKLYARVIIEPDLTMNIKRVLLPPGIPVPVPAEAPPPAAVPAARATRRMAKRATATNGPTAPATAALPMSIKKVAMYSSQVNFADLSVKPNFAAGIQGLEGTVVGLSSKPSSRAKVNLHGSVGQFAPVAITGELNVLGPVLHTDIGMSFQNMELTIFNPYSGKFAGYNISKGKLSTDLHYKVDDRKLDAQHHIVIDQLEFGDKTASKDAVSLPVKLAISLLKDRNGVIDLNLPVTGTLDDPKFKLSGVIWKVFVNILEKAVTAPFALLGSLFGGGPDIQFIDFQPGVETLDSAGADKVKAVEKALVERPQLKIEVPLGVVPDLDKPALIAERLKAEIGAAQTAKGKVSNAGPVPFEQLDPSLQVDVLARLYAKDLGAEPKFPETIAALKSKPDIAAAKVEFLRGAIRDHIQVGDGELQTLGQQRALAVQRVLLADPQVAAERVFLVANDKATAKDGVVRLELSLQ